MFCILSGKIRFELSPKILSLPSPFGFVNCLILLLHTKKLLMTGRQFIPIQILMPEKQYIHHPSIPFSTLFRLHLINVNSTFTLIITLISKNFERISRLMFTIAYSGKLNFFNAYFIIKQHLFCYQIAQ